MATRVRIKRPAQRVARGLRRGISVPKEHIKALKESGEATRVQLPLANADNANGSGRPTKKTPLAESLICKAVELGLSESTAGELCGLGRDVVVAWKRKDPTFAMKVMKARARAKAFVSGKLMELIGKGDFGAIMFWLRCRTDEFRERRENDTAGDDFAPDEAYL